MRFLFYDRILEIEKGRRILGLKGCGLSEEIFRAHFGRRAVVPAPIFMEAMAQVVGWGVIHAHDFRLSAIMSLVEGFRFEDVLLRPGFTATIGGEILSTSRRDSLCRCWVDADGRRIATLDRIIFAHFQPVDPELLIERFCYYSGWTRARLFPPETQP